MDIIIQVSASYLDNKDHIVMERSKKESIKENERILKDVKKGSSFNGNAAKTEIARCRARFILPHIREAQSAGVISLSKIARILMDRGVKAPRGGKQWTPTQVHRVILAVAKKKALKSYISRSP